jgi:hypothetical protein
MQAKEFDKLMIGDQMLKFAQMPRNNMSELYGLPVERAREVIEANEKPIPEKLHINIQLYVSRRRKAGCSEKAIRKSVMKKFNIAVF